MQGPRPLPRNGARGAHCGARHKAKARAVFDLRAPKCNLARAFICLRALMFLWRAPPAPWRVIYVLLTLLSFFFWPRAAALSNCPTAHASCAWRCSIALVSSWRIHADRPGPPNGHTRPRAPTLAPRWPVPAERKAPSAVSHSPTAQEKRKMSRMRSWKSSRNSPKPHAAARQQAPPRSTQVPPLRCRRAVFLSRRVPFT